MLKSGLFETHCILGLNAFKTLTFDPRPTFETVQPTYTINTENCEQRD